MLVAEPSMRNSRQRAVGLGDGARRGRRRRRGRSAWRAGCRSARWCGSRRSRSRRPARPARTAARRRVEHAARRLGRAVGAPWSPGSRAPAPRGRAARARRPGVEREVGQRRGRRRSAAAARTRSRPVTSSVTVCSTCSRALASMKTKRSPPSHRPGTPWCRGSCSAAAWPRLDRGGEQLLAQRHRQHVGRRDLDQLLPLALQAALAVPEVADRAAPSPTICTSMCRALGRNCST